MEANRYYLQGYSHGLELVAEQVRKLSYGNQTHEELLAVINGIIVALHQGKSEVDKMLSEEQEAFEQLMVVVSNGEELLSLLKTQKEGI